MPTGNPTSASTSLPLVPIRTWAGFFYLLLDGPRSVLIDTGLGGELGRLRRVLAAHGLGMRDVAAILLTHGHLDHIGNVARLRAETGAAIFAHPAEQARLVGRFRDRGWARVGGALEALGRVALRCRPTRIDRPLVDGDVLPWWGGLRVIHLPGHTAGHCGFLSERHGLLFAGDLFASYRRSAHLPPAIFNEQPASLASSLRNACTLGVRRVAPNHTFSTDWIHHAEQLKRLVGRA